MFGQGRRKNGVILELHPQCAFEPTDTEKLEELRSAVWPYIEKANEGSLPYSRLTTRELALVASPSKPFLYTSKNTPRRVAIVKDYAEEIDGAYQATNANA